MAPDLPLIGFDRQTLFRYSDYDTPFWARDNREPGRWHSVGDGATQYLAAHPDGARAEHARNEGLRTEADLLLVRTKIWAVELSQQALVDYSTFERAYAAGFPPEALIDDDYAACQTEGRRLRNLGYSGVVAPSAALPGLVNVTLFGRRMMSRWGAPSRLASSIPACVVAVGGPPAWIAVRVRHRGSVHTGYEEYLARKAELEREASMGIDIDADDAGTSDDAASSDDGFP